MSVSHVAECPDLGPACFGDGAPPTPYNHHVDQLMAETVFDLSLGLSEWFAIDARWSLRIADVNPTYSELDGTPKLVPNDIHHHDETLVDPTDPWLVARLAASRDNLFTMMRLGFSLPVGRTEPDPYALGREGQSHQHLQAGTGTVVPIVGVGLSLRVAEETDTPVTIALSGTGLLNVYENDEGFRAPSRLYANQRVSLALLDGRLSPFVEGTFAHETEEYWQGEVGLEGTNVRSEVYLGGGLAWRFAENWSADLAARGRVATLTQAPSFTTYGVFSLGISTRLSLWGGEGAAEPGPVIRERRDKGETVFEKK